MTDWLQAHAAPFSFEGTEVWEYNESTGLVYLTTVPRNYSRSRDHTYGLWWAKVDRPKPPEAQFKSEETALDTPRWITSRTAKIINRLATEWTITPTYILTVAVDQFAKRCAKLEKGERPIDI